MGGLPMGPGCAANQACVERNIVAQKTEDPAVFTVDYQGERTVSVLDTDYTHYVFFCLGAPLPSAEHSTMCQYLARTLKVDEEVVEKFNRALKSLPEHIQIIPDQTQGQGELWPTEAPQFEEKQQLSRL
ncbi:hypothetical protein HPG69_015624 [Diceros bicornis minor]|uniref:Lipocalin/cytosolic fatty-acid binding domain-containing protein n=1 Tax=Diceros bicornis minor TaxID=77932 RepID=A0A7J7EEM9_DICBM|nr:hypothetical protein HPG69_015624 [Diceros bicornis minor]